MEIRTAPLREAEPHDAFEAKLASFMRVHARPPEPRPAPRFSARLALQRAFVAAPTD